MLLTVVVSADNVNYSITVIVPSCDYIIVASLKQVILKEISGKLETLVESHNGLWILISIEPPISLILNQHHVFVLE
ncbi:hypothetical protein HanRHA438_Chr11g0529941 [Helianthus annuus]|uniref:Uncharacterized protein n=1 Tax=Helianthus annuus TaxID=4232 RepID=A0A9K3N2D9_HELAN|nr:hypothetical protein HanXRQr2_Chr11g0518401 [Helianthus annuus]KAJ0511920.1 hypothetical protein HanIR_Chr11g0557461 [Helianthus annuus]KAJ0519497.1 hypothetical protein HanHA89_Chr11g0449361 [Helianthus annuus]KAJ0614763.1 hypothetical protein HanIR_Chr02g0066071 [Helianthus annuus]KAJ0687494.1 hypothetical protein HanLR1_Chr11g0426661 [Helianthus annuus]